MDYGKRKWRKGSVFGDGPRVPLDREQKAQFKARLGLQRRPGRVTLAAEKIGLRLVDMLGADGALFPAHETLAKSAKVHLSTVKRALERLRLCGFLDWTRRLVRSAATGWRSEQTSNAYVLRLPSCEVHFARPVSPIRIKKEEWLMNKWLNDGDRAGPAALAARRATILARQAAEQASRRQM